MSNNENNDSTNRIRRGSVGNAVFSNLFQRSSTTGSASIFPSAAVNMNDPNRRRLSVSTLGIHGTSPSSGGGGVPYHYRRGSMSTNSDCIDESAIEDDDANYSTSSRTAPSTPFTRRMSFGNNRGFRTGGTSPGTGNANPAVPPNSPQSTLSRRSSVFATSDAPGSVSGGRSSSTRRASVSGSPFAQAQASAGPQFRSISNMVQTRPDQGAFNWPEQLRTRAESSVTGTRPSFSHANGLGTSPPRASQAQPRDRSKAVSEMPAPPSQPMKPKQPERMKPDAFQERILKGDFYMD